MKGLLTLIKLHRRQLDQLRRQIAEKETQKLQLHELLERMARELEAERELASQNAEMSQFYGGYAKRMLERQDVVVKEIQRLDKEIRELSLQITEKFSELKKYEIARDNRLKRQKEEADRKERIMFDDIAIQQHSRKTDS